MKTRPISYFDNNATTRIDPVVLEEMLPWLSGEYGNASSAYSAGRRAHAAVELARERVSALLNVRESEVLFTSCGTESINSAILSACSLDPDKTHIITSAVEHSATMKLCDHLAQRGYEITRLGVDAEGRLDLQKLEDAITEETAVVSLLWANNETGVLFPVREISEICTAKGVLLHLDAVQAVGKVPVDLATLEVSFLSLSGHKLYAPKGVGGLYVNRRVRFQPLLRGSQERGRRGGTENVASIVAFGKAAELESLHGFAEAQKAASLRDAFEDGILGAVPGCSVNGDRTARLPNTSNISFDGIESEGALLLLDHHGICCSAGSACTTGSVTPSHVLRAMGLGNERARASLRFSFGRFNQREEVEHALQVLPKIVGKLRENSPLAGSPVLSAS